MYLEALMRDLEQFPPRDDGAIDPTHRAAVAVVLQPDGRVLLIRRADREGDPWSGHMAFPGGKWQPGDATLHETAVRETHEEVGLDLHGACLPLGPLGGLQTPTLRQRSPISVTPYLFLGPTEPSVTPNEEVAAVHWIDLAQFVRHEGRGTMTYSWKGQELLLPCVRLQDMVVWGLTLRMVDDLVRRVERQLRAP